MNRKSSSAALTAICLTLALGAPALAAPHDPEKRRERELEEAVEQLREALEGLEDLKGLEDLDELRLAFRFSPRIDFESALDERPRLGFIYSPAAGDQGIKVLGVTPGGPAEEAGLLSGDLITHVDGVALAPGSRPGSASSRLIESVRQLDEGQIVDLKVVRDGQAVDLAVRARAIEFSGAGFDVDDLLELQDLAKGFKDFKVEGLEAFEELDFAAITKDALKGLEGLEGLGDLEGSVPWQVIAGHARLAMMPFAWRGLELVEVDDDLGKYFGVDEGLLVVKAPTDEDIELEGGDVIVEIGGRVPRDPAHAMRILSSYDSGEDIEMIVMRDGEREALEIEAPEGFKAFRREHE